MAGTSASEGAGRLACVGSSHTSRSTSPAGPLGGTAPPRSPGVVRVASGGPRGRGCRHGNFRPGTRDPGNIVDGKETLHFPPRSERRVRTRTSEETVPRPRVLPSRSSTLTCRQPPKQREKRVHMVGTPGPLETSYLGSSVPASPPTEFDGPRSSTGPGLGPRPPWRKVAETDPGPRSLLMSVQRQVLVRGTSSTDLVERKTGVVELGAVRYRDEFLSGRTL